MEKKQKKYLTAKEIFKKIKGKLIVHV